MDIEPTFKGYIEDEDDALLILQATLDGKLKHIPRRPYEIERPSEYALWTQFEVHCDKCHRIWLHSSPGDYYHQRTGAPHYFVSRCPECGGEPLNVIGLVQRGVVLFDGMVSKADLTKLPIQFYKDLLNV